MPSSDTVRRAKSGGLHICTCPLNSPLSTSKTARPALGRGRDVRVDSPCQDMSTSPTESLGRSPARDDPEVSFCDLSHNQEKKQGLTTSEARLWYEIKHLVCPGLVRSNKSVEVQGREMRDCLQVTEVHGSRGLTDGQPRKGRRRPSNGVRRRFQRAATDRHHGLPHQ